MPIFFVVSLSWKGEGRGRGAGKRRILLRVAGDIASASMQSFNPNRLFAASTFASFTFFSRQLPLTPVLRRSTGRQTNQQGQHGQAGSRNVLWQHQRRRQGVEMCGSLKISPWQKSIWHKSGQIRMVCLGSSKKWKTLQKWLARINVCTCRRIPKHNIWELNSIKLHDSLYTNEWEFVRYLHVIDALWLATNVEAQGHPFYILLYHVEKHSLAHYLTCYITRLSIPLSRNFFIIVYKLIARFYFLQSILTFHEYIKTKSTCLFKWGPLKVSLSSCYLQKHLQTVVARRIIFGNKNSGI